jgi:hypothetical protein
MYTEKDLLSKIANLEEENLNLDYKASGSLDKSPSKKEEITKDVSAMANSDGGLIIYGISEFAEQAKRHLPEKISTIARSEFPKEWIENIITNIRPHISGLVVHSIQLSIGANDVAYVIEIPKSTTAHQAMDKRYYKRFNFKSIPMEDYEIRDVMNRITSPQFEISIKIYKTQKVMFNGQDVFRSTLHFEVEHVGGPYAKYLIVDFQIPEYWQAEVIDRTALGSHSSFNGQVPEQVNQISLVSYRLDRIVPSSGGPSFVPLLRGDKCKWIFILRSNFFGGMMHRGAPLKYRLICDSATPVEKLLWIEEIPIE